MASTAKQYSYTNASAWIQSTNISASHSGTNVTISGNITMWTAGSYQGSGTRYVVVNINGTNYHNTGSRTGSWSTNTTYTIPYSVTINVGNYNAGSLTIGFYISASSSSLSSSGTLIWNGETSTSTSDCSLKTTSVSYAKSWTNATAPTSVSITPTHALSGSYVTVSWSGASAGTGNAIADYAVLRDGTVVHYTSSTSASVLIPGTSAYTFTVRTNAAYNEAVSSASDTVTGYTQVSGPTSVTGGTSGYVKAGANFTLSWSGASGGTNNAISYYTVNGTSTGGTGTSQTKTAPSAGNSANYAVKAVGVRNSTQFGSASRTIYGVSINQVAALNVSPTTIIDSVTLSWAHPTINSASTSGLSRQYILQFSLNSSNWTNIATGITGTSYTWNPTTGQVPYGSLVYFRIIPYVYYGTTQITDGTARATNSFLRGELPNKIKKVIIQNTNNIGTPATRIFDNIDTTLTVSGSLARLQNGIKLTITPGAKKSGYIRGIAGRWSRYGPTGTSGSVISTGTIAFTQVPGETESVAGSGDIVVTIPAGAAIYSAADNDVIQFEIWAVSRISGNNIPSQTVDLTTNATNVSAHFRWNAMPYLRTSPGPLVSQGPSTIVPINFNDNIGAAVNVTQILGQDETTIDFTNCAYKLYCRDITTNPSSTYVSVLSSTYNLFGAGGTYSGDMFIPTDGSADQTLTLPIIGAGSAFLEAVLGGPLSAVNRLVKLQYKITTVDSLLREGTSGVYEFQLQYDFRTVPVMESAPTLYSSGSYPAERSIPALNGPYTCIPLVNGFGSEPGDAIVFEWQPAYDANNKTSYSESGTHRIDYSTGIDPIKEYRLYRYSLQNGVFAYKADTKLIAGTDYFPVNDGGYLKYRGRYNINLTNANKDEIIYLKIVPVASNNKTNPNDVNTKLNKNFYGTRLSTPLVVLNTAERDPVTPTKAVLTLALSDNGGSKQVDTITIDATSWASSYYNLNELKLSRTVVGVSPAVDVSYLGSAVPFTLPNGTEIAGLNIVPPIESLDARLGYQIAVTATIRYTRITTAVVDNQIAITFNSNQTLTSGQSLLYVPPVFGTLALRKNKVAINKSDLEETEEVLTVVAKDRVDSGADYYKNVIGVHGNDKTQMPDFDGVITNESSLTRAKGSYLGFYTSDESGEITWHGSFGFETNGDAYLVTDNNGVKRKTRMEDAFTPRGGTTGQFLSKNSGNDYDVAWKTITKATVGLDNVPNVDFTSDIASLNNSVATLNNEVTDNSILTKLKQVDGAGSGLDADLLDGKHAADFFPIEGGIASGFIASARGDTSSGAFLARYTGSATSQRIAFQIQVGGNAIVAYAMNNGIPVIYRWNESGTFLGGISFDSTFGTVLNTTNIVVSTVSTTTVSGTNYHRRVVKGLDGMVTVQARHLLPAYSSAGWVHIFTISAGSRPQDTAYFMSPLGAGKAALLGAVGSNGQVRVYRYGDYADGYVGRAGANEIGVNITFQAMN